MRALLGPISSLLLLLGACGERSFEPAWTRDHRPPPPNVLVLSVDTLRADHLGFYGYGKPTSPHLDHFAASAVVFERALASASWTLPALASAFTGTFSSTHQCWSFGSRLSESFTTLPEALTAAGYDSACFVSHLFCTSRHGLQQGFVHGDDAFAHPAVEPDVAVTSERIADEGVRFLQRKAAAPDGTPWLLWLHFFDPHANYVEHPGISGRFVTPGPRENVEIDRDLYDGEIAFTDEHVGRALEALERTGASERTVVVFLADHGEEFQDHGGTGHGHTLYEELLRVPLVIRAPGIAPARVGALVRTVDLLPTVFDLVGLAPDAVPECEGASLRPHLERESARELPALFEIRQNPAYTLEGIAEGRWKLVRPLVRGGASALYDLEEDPRESRDVSEQEPEVALRLIQLLRGMRESAEERARGLDLAPGGNLTPAVLEQLRGLGYVGGDR